MKPYIQTSTTAAATYPATLEYGNLAVANNGIPAFGNASNVPVPLASKASVDEVNSNLALVNGVLTPANQGYVIGAYSVTKMHRIVVISAYIKYTGSFPGNQYITIARSSILSSVQHYLSISADVDGLGGSATSGSGYIDKQGYVSICLPVTLNSPVIYISGVYISA